MTTRRAVLLGGVGLVAAGCGSRGDTVPAVPTAAPGAVVSGSFRSRLRGGRATGWAVAYPPGVAPGSTLPVAVFLHGRYQDHRTAFGSGHGRVGLDHYLAAWSRSTGRAFAIASVDGGDHYWHPRPGGEDAGAMVLDEFLPLLAGRGLRAGPGDRVALTGLSMGGYGSLRLAGMLGPGRCAAVAVMSPALWTDPASASTAGFADAEEYRRFTVFGRQQQLAGIPLRIDCGTRDPFRAATASYAKGLPVGSHPVVRFEPGAHDLAFWRRRSPALVAFVGRRLA